MRCAVGVCSRIRAHCAATFVHIVFLVAIISNLGQDFCNPVDILHQNPLNPSVHWADCLSTHPGNSPPRSCIWHGHQPTQILHVYDLRPLHESRLRTIRNTKAHTIASSSGTDFISSSGTYDRVPSSVSTTLFRRANMSVARSRRHRRASGGDLASKGVGKW